MVVRGRWKLTGRTPGVTDGGGCTLGWSWGALEAVFSAAMLEVEVGGLSPLWLRSFSGIIGYGGLEPSPTVGLGLDSADCSSPVTLG